MAWNSLIWLAAVAVLTLSAPAQAAKLYKWVDERGNVTYLDRPPPEGEGGRVEEKTLRVKPGSSGDPTVGMLAARSPVVLYVTAGCSPCDTARSHLQKRGVPFREIDVSEKNPEAQEEMRKKVGQLSVPTITVGGRVMRGYMDSLLDGELDQAGYPKTGIPVPPAAAEGENATEGATPPQ